jgi:DNA-binding NtrC family response regulator
MDQNSEGISMTTHVSQPNAEALLPDQPLYILCVDDQEDILKALARLFRKESFRVLTASSGKEALDLLKKTPNIGMIISDHRMPEMSGTDFLRAAVPLAPDAPRVIMTGYADMNTAIEAINLGGASHFLTKPINDNELLQVVRNGLQRYELVVENRRQIKELEEWNTNLKARVLQQSATIRKQMEGGAPAE